MCAVAAVTASKDTTLRDFAQGCWRMRGLATGQCLHVLIIPELIPLIQRVSHTGNLTCDIVAWLAINGMRSAAIQSQALVVQNARTVWRREAFSHLQRVAAQRKLRGGTASLVDCSVADEHTNRCTSVFREVCMGRLVSISCVYVLCVCIHV